MRPAEVVRRGSRYLERHGVEAPEVSAEALMMLVLETDRAALYARERGLSSAEALARENAERLRLAVDVRAGDLFEPLPEECRRQVDLVVANPPYLSIEVAADLPPEVHADPPEALFGGLEVTRRLITEAFAWLRTGGGLAVECDERAAAAVGAAARDAGFEEAF